MCARIENHHKYYALVDPQPMWIALAAPSGRNEVVQVCNPKRTDGRKNHAKKTYWINATHGTCMVCRRPALIHYGESCTTVRCSHEREHGHHTKQHKFPLLHSITTSTSTVVAVAVAATLSVEPFFTYRYRCCVFRGSPQFHTLCVRKLGDWFFSHP